MNPLLSLKIRELSYLDKKFTYDNSLIEYVNDSIIHHGCNSCYMKHPESDEHGYFFTEGRLINLWEKYNVASGVPKNIAINVWLCPVCEKPILDLIPELHLD